MAEYTPTPGRVVWYHTIGDDELQFIPAMVTASWDNWPELYLAHQKPATPFHASLTVFGLDGPYVLHNVPPGKTPGSWSWPVRTS
jgi:predicted esterase